MATISPRRAAASGPALADTAHEAGRAAGLGSKPTWRGRRLDALALALFVGASLVMLYPYPLQLTTHAKDLGDSLEYAWVLGYAGPKLLADPLHLYDGNIFYPFKGSLAYSDSTLANALLALPVIALTGNPILAGNLLILLSFVLAGLGAYLLVSRLTGSRGAGLVAGAVFAFNPYRIDHMTQLPNVSSHWLPFVFYALERFLALPSRRWAAAFALFLALQVLSSFYYAYAVCLALALYVALLVAWRGRRLLRRRMVVPALPAVLAAAVVLLAVGLPYFAVSQQYGMVRTLQDAAEFGASLPNYLAVTPSNRLWGQLAPMVQSGTGERHLFPGLLALVLAAAGLAWGRPRLACLLYGAVGLGAFLLSLGPDVHLTAAGPPLALPFPTPYRVLYDYLPGFQALRVPARFAVVVMLALSVLAGLGFAPLLQRARAALAGRRPRMGWAPPPALAMLATAVVLAEYAAFPLPMEPVRVGEAIPAVYKWLRQQPDKGVMVELPLNDNASYQAPYEYYSTYHGWTLVNGARSFFPPGYKQITDTLHYFPSTNSLALLTDLGVKYVLVHGEELPAGDLERRESRVAFFGDSLRLAAQFGDDRVYEVLPPVTRAPLDLSLVAPRRVTAGERVQVGLLLGADDWRMVALPEVARQVTLAAVWTGEDGRRYGEQVVAAGPGQVFRLPALVDFSLTAPAAAGTYALSVAVNPPLAAAQSGPPVQTVTVQPAAAAAPTGEPRLQAASYDLPLPAVAASEPLPLRIRWTASGGLSGDLEVFVNVYDDGYRVWSHENRPLTGDPFAAGWLERAGEAVDVRTVRLSSNTPPGYYWVEFGVMDRATQRRLPIRDADGKLVDKITVGRVRAGSEVHPFGAAAVCPRAGAAFGEQIALCGWQVPTADARAGGSLALSLYWRALRPPAANYNVFVHLYDGAGRLVAQVDGVPGRGAWPTSAWRTDDLLEDDYQLPLPAALPPGEYTLATGLYDLQTLRRLPVAGTAAGPSDTVTLAHVRLAGPP